MGIRLKLDEAWAAIEVARTGVLTTLRADGGPIALPVWFVVRDRTICVETPAWSKKVTRIRRDPRASFLVDNGERWQDLVGIHLNGSIAEETDAAEASLIKAALDTKYAQQAAPYDRLPEATQRAYADMIILRFVPDHRVLSWDNNRIPLRS